MQTIKVKRVAMLERVKANRDAHRALFLKAQEGYRARVVEELDRMLEGARRGDPLQTYVALEAPEDHTAEYDREIDMLTMSVEDEIVVDQLTFRNLVRNEWAWFEAASLKNATYAAGAFVASPRHE